MSLLEVDALTSKTVNTDLTITGNGTGKPDVEAGFKIGGVAPTSGQVATDTGWADLPSNGFRGCLATSSGDSISSGTWVVIDWDQEQFDTDNLHDNSTNPSRITIPAGLSKIRLTAHIQFSLVQGVGTLYQMQILKNGAQAVYTSEAYVSAGRQPPMITTNVIPCSENDYFQVRVYQDDATHTISSYGSFGCEVFE